MIKIDIDVEDDWESEYKILKAFYMYSDINREIVPSKHGYHVFIDAETSETARIMFGDDVVRVELDGKHHIKDVLFTSKYIIKMNKDGAGYTFIRSGREAISKYTRR